MLLCFVKADCPTCRLSLPLVEAAHRAVAEAVDVWVIGQDEDSAPLVRAHDLTVPLLDDGALRVSHRFAVEIVPTVVLADGDGTEHLRFEGFDRADWQGLLAACARLARVPAPAIAWDRLPASRPGCGSRSVEPGIAERLAAEAGGGRLGARPIEIPDAEDPFEFLFDQGLTDGLPVVPPTPERVLRMLAGTRRDPAEIVAVVAPNMVPATVEKVAINAVMAGCRPEYLPVVLAAVEAACSEEFNLHGVLATTHVVGPVVIVNGPVRRRIGMNAGVNALGQGNRANATIGRALQLVVRNVGGGRPGEVDQAALGQPGKLGFCFPEHEERSPWEPLHVERGFARDDSTVTLFAGGAPITIVDQLARDAEALATSYGLVLAAMSHPKHYRYGDAVLIVPPEHADTFARSGWTKDQVRDGIQKASMRPVEALVRDAVCAEGLPPAVAAKLAPGARLPKFGQPESIRLVVAGGEAGKFGACLPGWTTSGPTTGSAITTRRIGE